MSYYCNHCGNMIGQPLSEEQKKIADMMEEIADAPKEPMGTRQPGERQASEKYRNQ